MLQAARRSLSAARVVHLPRLSSRESAVCRFPHDVPPPSSSFIRSSRRTGVSTAHAAMALSGIPYDEDNIFKKIIAGDVPCYKIFETDHALAFLDAFPMAKGHALLIPKATGYASIIDMPPDVAAEVLKELPRLAKVVKDATGCDGVNIVQNNGAKAGQVVFHVHFHVLPRWDGDGLVKLGKSGDMIAKEDATALLEAMHAKM